jgi:hypothetical protein
MAKKNLNIWVIVLIVILVAVAATLITTKMTGNAVSVYTSTCKDSDGGKNYSIKGIVNSRWSSYTDACTNTTRLREYSCNGASVSATYYSCQNGCSNGACNKTSTSATTPDICQKLFNAINYSWHTSCGDLKYDIVSDINNDGLVDVYDLNIFAKNSQNESWCVEQARDFNNNPCKTIGGFNFVAKSDYVEVQVPIESGLASFGIIGTGLDYRVPVNFTVVGKSSTDRLVTSSGRQITFDNTNGVDAYFVASYYDGKTKESYLLSATATTKDGANRTTIRDEVTGKNICEDVTAGNSCFIGNVHLSIDKVYVIGGSKYTVISAISSTSFNKLYATDGTYIYLPVKEELPRTNYDFTIFNSDGSIAKTVLAYGVGTTIYIK